MNTGKVTINVDHILFATMWGPNGIQFKFTNGETLIAVYDHPENFLLALQLGNL
jgi:hypothetical protein